MLHVHRAIALNAHEGRVALRSCADCFLLRCALAQGRSVFAVAEDGWSLVSESCFLLAPLELGTVDPDAMQNDSELAGDSGLGLLDADTFGQPHTPSFQD